MEPRYISQIDLIGKKAQELNLNLQEVSDFWHNCYRAASNSYPKAPPIYLKYRAELQTWNHYIKPSNRQRFPGKDPLYDCLLTALEYIEKQPGSHIKAEDGSQAEEIEALQSELELLKAANQQKDQIIASKDDLIKVKNETLQANKALMSEKDRINQAKGAELFEKVRIIHQKDKELDQYLAKIKTLEQQLAKKERDAQADERWISNLRGILTRRDQDIAGTERDLKRLQKRMEDQSAELMKQISEKDQGIQALWGEIDRLRALLPDEGEVKNEGEPMIKSEFLE